MLHSMLGENITETKEWPCHQTTRNRKTGLYKEQIEQWKIAALSGYQNSIQAKKYKTKIQREDRNKIKKLERELNRKDKALAETASLLVLSKKWNAIWEENEDD
jgi:transposase